MNVKRHVKNKRRRVTQTGVQAKTDYLQYSDAVDRNGQDNAYYSTALCSNQHYLRLFYWALNHVIHCLFQIICYYIVHNIGPPEQKQYLDKHVGRHAFQINFGISLMNDALAFNCDRDTDNWPDYVLSKNLSPCEYEKSAPMLHCWHTHHPRTHTYYTRTTTIPSQNWPNTCMRITDGT